MKFIFISLILISQLAFAQATDEVTPTPSTNDTKEDIQGTYAKPTPKQKKSVRAPTKTAKKKKSIGQIKTVATHKKGKNFKPKKSKKISKNHP